MQAIVSVGNKQFKVKAGDFIRTDLRKDKPKTELKLKVVGFIDDSQFFFSEADLKKSLVKATVIRHGLEKKILVFKKKRRKGYRKTRGHRQGFTELKIVELKSSTGKTSKSKQG